MFFIATTFLNIFFYFTVKCDYENYYQAPSGKLYYNENIDKKFIFLGTQDALVNF